MWFVFPQVADLGKTAALQHFAISSIEQAQTCLSHQILGPRLRRCAQILVQADCRSASKIFGDLDAQKLYPLRTLFLPQPGEQVLQRVLDNYFDGIADAATEALT